MRLGRIIFVLLFFAVTNLYGEEREGSLGRIISEIDNYEDRTITLDLRLKHLDRIFEKIVFYDSENIDIEFDTSGKERKKALARDLLNLHEGMLYSVTFRVIGTGNLGGLLGEIEGFKPLVIDIIPEKRDGSD